MTNVRNVHNAVDTACVEATVARNMARQLLGGGHYATKALVTQVYNLETLLDRLAGEIDG